MVPVTKQQLNPRLELYISLFGQGTNKTCDKTGLQLTYSLNYSLHTFLHLSDVYWVLAIIDTVDDSKTLNEKYGTQNTNCKNEYLGIM